MTVDALPPRVRAGYDDAMKVLELVPWNGPPYNKALPEGNMRTVVFGPDGAGFVTYLILEDQQRVDVLQVTWMD